MTKHDYAVPHVPAEWAANPHVLRWWGAEQDAVLAEQIKTSAWLYHWRLHPAIEAITVPDTYERWREADSLCVQYAHYNLVMYFGVARAQALGLESLIRRPQEKRCVLCKSGFSESQVAPWAVDRLGGVDAIDFCQECSQNGCYGVPESAATTRSAMIEYATRLASLFGSVPPQGILSSGQPFAGMSADLRRELLELGMTQPGHRICKGRVRLMVRAPDSSQRAAQRYPEDGAGDQVSRGGWARVYFAWREDH